MEQEEYEPRDGFRRSLCRKWNSTRRLAVLPVYFDKVRCQSNKIVKSLPGVYEIIYETDTAFGKIRDGVEEVRRNVDEEKVQMERLMSANAEIVESIHTISAVTQEVTANTNQTQEITMDNGEIVNQVTLIAQELSGRVTELASYI